MRPLEGGLYPSPNALFCILSGPVAAHSGPVATRGSLRVRVLAAQGGVDLADPLNCPGKAVSEQGRRPPCLPPPWGRAAIDAFPVEKPHFLQIIRHLAHCLQQILLAA